MPLSTCTVTEWPQWLKGPPDLDRLRHDLSQLSRIIAASWAAPDSTRLSCYHETRLWNCLVEHGKRLGTLHPLRWEELVNRLRAGDLGYECPQSDVLRDVAFAGALEWGAPAAADDFDRDWMPLVRGMAHRLRGPVGRDLVDNFAAELVLPRGDLGPRIANYRGKTSFKSWLQVVVANVCADDGPRVGRDRIVSGSDGSLEHQPAMEVACDVSERHNCVELLRPAVRTALQEVSSEDRLLVKLVHLDDVPQQHLAQALRIHPGNVTRRRQRAISAIWSAMTRATNAGSARFRDCLQLILAGDDVEAQRSLGQALAECLSQSGQAEVPS